MGASNRPKCILPQPAILSKMPSLRSTHATVRRLCCLRCERAGQGLPSKARPAIHAGGLHIQASLR